jgi:hypothetical protein
MTVPPSFNAETLRLDDRMVGSGEMGRGAWLLAG